ncbi:tetratricopeptide repeat protein [Embleya scabrispora]|uniref:tetratricopeptide repeat protein n=1 Tax=Embleya scabrispora TaxID=159449 RepID=UPI000366CBB2|nr:tetratricopeptide repeat protein [Embleya scabrispora]MYS85242.1 tetratricopeptide repeat protein [Streptomyces sp. SID5474]
MQPRNMSMRGVVDLGAVKAAADNAAKRAAAPAGKPAAASGAQRVVIDVTEATFETEVLALSQQAPVVIDFWAEWCQPCKQLSPLLERLAEEYAGRFVLAKIDVDANPRLAQEFGIQGIPAVMAVLGGQLAPLFQGVVPEQQARQVLDQLVQLGEERFGLTGVVVDGEPADAPAEAEEEPAGDPLLAAADEALEAGDLDGAAQAFRNVISDHPAHAEAKLGLINTELLLRTQGVDTDKARVDAAEHPDDVAAQTLAADLDILDGRADEAFARLVETVRRTAGEDRNKARLHLLDLFEIVGADDPRVPKARMALAGVLF